MLLDHVCSPATECDHLSDRTDTVDGQAPGLVAIVGDTVCRTYRSLGLVAKGDPNQCAAASSLN
jgi:hypothetical protein